MKNNNEILVFDTDPGLDDATALLLLSRLDRYPDYVVATYGNAPVETTYRNAVVLTRFLGEKAYVAAGASEALTGAKHTFGDFHGIDGMAGIAEELTERTGASDVLRRPAHTLTDLAEELKKQENITYIAVGPLTTLAILLRDGKIRKKISRVLVMGGGIRQFNRAHDAEYNFAADPIAVGEVLNSGVDLTIFPLDLTNEDASLTDAQIDGLEAIGTLPEYIRMFRHNLISNGKYNHLPLAVLHDTMPALYAGQPEPFYVVPMKLRSDEWGHIGEAEDGKPAKVVLSCQKELLPGLLKAVFEAEKKKMT